MRVAFVPGSFRPDRCGVSHYTARLMAELAARGIDCHVLTTAEAAQHHSRPEVIGATPGWGPEMLTRLPAELRRLNPDVLHIQHAAGSFSFRRTVLWLPPFLRLARWHGPLVVTLHEYGWWIWQPPVLQPAWRALSAWGERRSLWDREDGLLLTGADTLIVTHDATARLLHERLPQLAGRVELVPIASNIPIEPVETRIARQELRRRFGWAANTFVLAYFGFLHPVKGLETLLAAMPRILQQAPQTRLLLIGGVQSLALRGDEAARYQARLETQIRALGLGSVVRLTGYLPDEAISRYLSGADLGVLPFNAGVTAKSGALLALWSHGLPVVATRPAAPPAGLESKAALVPPRDPEALAARVLDLLAHPRQRRALADRGRAGASDNDWSIVAERHLAIYERLMGDYHYIGTEEERQKAADPSSSS